MAEIYFDNSATTRISAASKEAMLKAIDLDWGNPSAVHKKGVEAEKLLAAAREDMLRAVGLKNLRSYRVIFTGSGTESDNLAIMGTLFGRKYRGTPRIITTDSEHPAVENTMKTAEKNGFEVIRLGTKDGVIDPDELDRALNNDTVLVSIMRVNNETGALYDIEKIFSTVKQRVPDAITHTDAVQGFMKVGCNPQRLKADLLSVSGHKIGGPKGIGALYVSDELIFHKKLEPIIFGGGQEWNLRSGTENMIGIVGMAAAAKERSALISDDREKVGAVRSCILQNLPNGAELNEVKGEYLPNIISIYVPNIKSEVLVRHLSSLGIYVSAGSACSSKKLKTSTALSAFGLSPTRADSTIRVSISHENTEDEAYTFASALCEAMSRLSTIRK